MKKASDPCDTASAIGRLTLAAGWLAAFSPALITLLCIVSYRVPVPYHDSWAFVEQYQSWVEGRYSWAQFFAPHNMHPSAFGKLLYFATLHWLRGDMTALVLMNWFLSLGVALSVLIMLRSVWMGHPLRGICITIIANLTIFTAAQGGTWLWDFVFQNYMPGFCLAVGLLVLSSRWLMVARICVSMALSVIAAFSFGSGFTVGFLLAPMVWLVQLESSPRRRRLVTGTWCLLALLVTLLVLKGTQIGAVAMGSSSNDSGTLDRPWMALQYILIVLGSGLGKGTPMEHELLCMICGAIGVLVLFAGLIQLWRRRKELGLYLTVWPWLAFVGFGLANAVMICTGRMSKTFLTALAPRYVVFSLFFVLGVIMLTVVLALRDVTTHPSSCRTRGWKVCAAPAAMIIILLQCANWGHGVHQMQWFHNRLAQNRASFVLARVLPLQPERFWQLDGRTATTRLAVFLDTQNKLQGVTMVSSNSLSAFRQARELPEKMASFDTLQVMSGGTFRAAGKAALTKSFEEVADLVLITAVGPGQEEKIVAFNMPLMPEDFFESTAMLRAYASHYCGWEIQLKREELPQGTGVILRAYVFDGVTRRVRPIVGQFKVDTLTMKLVE